MYLYASTHHEHQYMQNDSVEKHYSSGHFASHHHFTLKIQEDTFTPKPCPFVNQLKYEVFQSAQPVKIYVQIHTELTEVLQLSWVMAYFRRMSLLR